LAKIKSFAIEKIGHIKQLQNSKIRRKLPLFGKVAVIKSLFLPKVVFLANCTHIPKWAPIDLNKLVFDFLWNGPDRIKRDVQIIDYNEGGL
jgi:hypothetical protein